MTEIEARIGEFVQRALAGEGAIERALEKAASLCAGCEEGEPEDRWPPLWSLDPPASSSATVPIRLSADEDRSLRAAARRLQVSVEELIVHLAIVELAERDREGP